MNAPVDLGLARQAFILSHGWRARASELAAVTGLSVDEVEGIRSTLACSRLPKANGFPELFEAWNGRQPEECDYPPPARLDRRDTYEWQAPEVALLASLVGTMSVPEIAGVLTKRLREKTGDPAAERGAQAVQIRVNQIGLQASDVVGGITITEAARETGSGAIIRQSIAKGELAARRVGRLYVIPHAAWKAWKAKRTFPPKGYVQLNSLREPLGIKSDKLSEFARAGLIPTAIRCNPYGTKGASTRFGTWWIDGKAARKLLADRRKARPMPWHGAALADNLRATYKRWSARKHPASCKTCREIWGKKGAPKDFDQFAARYPALEHGAKRHLTRPWSPGLTIAEVAQQAGRSSGTVKAAIKAGMLAATREGRTTYVSRTDATRWITRKCPTGGGEKSWITLDTACDLYLFSKRELSRHIKAGTLVTRKGVNGPQRGLLYVSRHQVGQLRQQIGFTEDDAARRAGVTVPRLRELMQGAGWRVKDGKIPLATVQAVIKRLKSNPGHSIEEAAALLGQTANWVRDRVRDGVIKLSRSKADKRRVYVTEPMLARLREFQKNPARAPAPLGDDWLRLSEAAAEGGVCTATLIRWAVDGGLERRQAKNGWRYHRQGVRAIAREYWKNPRLRRAARPAWLSASA